ncbi:hypothetical protein MLM06_03135 [Escherichia coli]|nr:hypothetical protein [Escherichia coli]
MQHETKMENQSWLKKLARRLGPGHVVNLCFIVVLLFSTLLTWREVVVLEDAYISSQRMLLKYMGGLQGLRNASVEEIAKVPGISQGLAEKIFWSLKH